jgi:hypothetical protein
MAVYMQRIANLANIGLQFAAKRIGMLTVES